MDKKDTEQEKKSDNLSKPDKSKTLSSDHPKSFKKTILSSFHLPKIPEKKKGTILFKLPQEFSSLKVTSKFPKLQELIIKYAEKYSLSDIGAKLFLPKSRPLVHKIFLIASICISSYMSGKFTAMLLRPSNLSSMPKGMIFPTTTKVVFSDISGIADLDLFKAEGEFSQVPIKITDTGEVCHQTQSKSSLPIKLVNSIVLMDSIKSLASVQVRNNNDFSGLREGDIIPSLAKIDKIEKQRIIIKNLNNGQCEYIQNDLPVKRPSTTNFTVLDPKKGKGLIASQNFQGITNKGNSFNIKKSLRNKMLSNISEVLTQARAVQIKNPDGSLAFKMTEIVPGSIYSKLNIQEGDIITSINGKKFTNIGELMTLFNQIATIDEFQVTLNREGSAQTLEYNFE